MRNKITLLLLFVISFGFSQTVFEKFNDKTDVDNVIVTKKMFELMSKMKGDSETDKNYKQLLTKLDDLKVYTTANTSRVAEMKTSVNSYLKSNPLQELMSAQNDNKKVSIYVNSNTSNIIKELLLFIESPLEKEKKGIIMLLTGSFTLSEITALTDKMKLPGGDEIKKASK